MRDTMMERMVQADAAGAHCEVVQAAGRHEEVELPVVVEPDAVADVGAVVVVPQHAAAAAGAVDRPRRAVHVAAHAVLGADDLAVDEDLEEPRRRRVPLEPGEVVVVVGGEVPFVQQAGVAADDDEQLHHRQDVNAQHRHRGAVA
ncbi:deaminase [Babesia caballi]|uniref:Deaminase n=1 Tax=Babesia caballi TaxID=5871 RepID=A0AAV4LQ18_BABCB|nr:deaminase [Babesia caballi]